MTERRVVVTGIGPVTPVGIGLKAFWDGIVSGRPGGGDVTLFDASEFPVRTAAEVRDFDPTVFMEPKAIKRTDRAIHFAVAAAKLAWDDAGTPQVEPSRTAVVVSTGIGGLTTMLAQTRVLFDRGPGKVSAFLVPAMMPNASAGQVAMEMGFTGPNTCIVTACAAGAHGVGEGYRYILDGLADVCLAGGTEAVITPLSMAGFAQMQALSRHPDGARASRPFDAERDGFVLAEGACILVLEEAERAEARGARIYAELAGYGASADAYHITAPEPQGSGAVLAIEATLADAGEPPEAVDYINAHGTSTPLNDASETRALKKVFGDHAYKVPISSTKSMTGHMLGAAGAVEAAVAALAIKEGVVPPTINYETPDPECDLDYVPNESRKADVRLALSNSFGFGGQNAVLAMRRP
ncbi:MAG TPA: beta-ketoacyl-ACP synthase II [Actinomycetota bacterium]|jgi:3-oxoacyl-[acyl-carrier-protein] synthase II|nr:beta-ketoacyl-ACP synthase II [Actinomycetota bacterium]